MPVGVALAKIPSGRLSYYNRRAIEMIGHPLLETGDVSGYAHYGAVHEDGRAYAPEEYPIARAVLRGEAVDGGEMRYRRGDGRVVWLAVSAAPVRAEGTALAVSAFTDITELRHIQEALRRTLAQQHAVYANAPVGLSAHDRSLRFLAVNARLAAMNGIAVEAHIGRTPREAVPQVAPHVEPSLRQVLTTGEHVAEVEIETETAAHPGRKRFYLASYYPVRAEAGLRELAATLERRVEERTLALFDMVAQLDAFACRRLSRANTDVGRVDLEAVVDAAVRDLVARGGRPPPPGGAGPDRDEPPRQRGQVGHPRRARPRVRIRAEERPESRAGGSRTTGSGLRPSTRPAHSTSWSARRGQESYPGTGIGLAIVRKGTERMGGRPAWRARGPGAAADSGSSCRRPAGVRGRERPDHRSSGRGQPRRRRPDRVRLPQGQDRRPDRGRRRR